jgi:hypothetical protein
VKNLVATLRATSEAKPKNLKAQDDV